MARKLLAGMAAAGLALGAWAYSDTVDGIAWTYDIVGGKARIYGGEHTAAIPTGAAGNITVPSTLGGCPVKSIGSWAFYGRDKVVSVSLPLGLETIEENAFFGSPLEAVDIPSGVTTIGANAFYGTSLRSAWTPATATSIGTGAFAGCTSLRAVQLTGSLTSLPAHIFKDCAALEAVDIPDAVTDIGALAFGGCSSLKEIALPDGVTSIADSAFSGAGLKAVYVSEGKTAAVKAAGLDPAAGGFRILEVGAPTTCDATGYTWTYRPIGEAGGVQEAEILAGVYPAPSGTITVPSTLDGLAVTRLGDDVFNGCGTLTGVELPATLTRIGDCAFYGCFLLEDLSIPDGVTAIGGSAFYDCDTLASVTIPGSVTTVGDSAFYDCANLASVVVGNGVKHLGSHAFYNCGALKSAALPASLTSIGDAAFYDCSVLENVEIPAGVASIGDSAFRECDALTDVAIPDGVERIGDEAFYGCDLLKSVELGLGLTRIGDGTFANCAALESVEIPGGVVQIGPAAFSYCYALESVAIPAGVTVIGADAFDSTIMLASVYAAKGGSTAVEDRLVASGLSTAGITFYESFAVAFDANGGHPSSSRLSIDGKVGRLPTPTRDGFTFLGWFTAPVGGAQLTSPAAAVTADATYYAHWIRDGYATEVVDGIEWTYRIVGGKAEVGNGGDAAVPTATSGAITIPAKLGGKAVTRVASGAFKNCSALTDVTIPDGVASVGDAAFAGCTGVKSLTVSPYLCSAADLTATAFPDSKSTIEKVVFPDSVTSVAENAFRGLTAVNAVTLSAGVCANAELDMAFPDAYSGIASVAFGAGVTTIGASLFYDCDGLTTLPIPDGVTTIGDHAFQGCDGLLGGTIPQGVVTLGDSAFAGCSGLVSVYIPVGATSIGSYAFSDCTSLELVQIPDSVADIGYSAFENCNPALLDTTTIPGVTLVDGWAVDSEFGISGTVDLAGVRGIGAGAFSARAGITGVKIPNGATSIGDNAFADCDGLPEVTVPDSVTHIGGYAFGSCDSLKKAILPMAFKGKLNPTVFQHCPDDLVILYHAVFTVTFDANGGTVGETSRKVDSLNPAIGKLPVPNSRKGYDFNGWFTAKSGGTKISASTTVTQDVTYYAQWTAAGGGEGEGGGSGGGEGEGPGGEGGEGPGGQGGGESGEGEGGGESGEGEGGGESGGGDEPEPEVVYELYSDVTGPAPTLASEYNGYLVDAARHMQGTIQVKVGKPNARTGLATVRATVQLLDRKLTLKAAENGKSAISKDAPTVVSLVGKGAEPCTITIGAEALSGFYGDWEIDGARNFFTSKDKAEQAAANELIAPWLGGISIVSDEGNFTVTVMNKGKARVSGTLDNGRKVSGTAVFLVGGEWGCVPFASPRAGVSFSLWMPLQGGKAAVRGLGDGARAGKSGALKAGARFHVDAAAFTGYLPYLPNELTVEQSGARWVVAGGARAGRVAYLRGTKTVDESKLGANPSALKLTSKANGGSFKGTFKVYADVNGRLKATTVNVTGVVIDGTGYGTATIKNGGSAPVAIE